MNCLWFPPYCSLFLSFLSLSLPASYLRSERTVVKDRSLSLRSFGSTFTVFIDPRYISR